MERAWADPNYFRQMSCSRCRRADHLVDADIHIQYEGPVGICRGCIADLALKAGLYNEDTREFHAEEPEPEKKAKG